MMGLETAVYIRERGAEKEIGAEKERIFPHPTS